jgi:hypothetical protein
MTKKCKFDVEVTYNSDFFAEGEIRETIKKAIRDLNDKKEKKFGRQTISDPGRTNHGLTGNVNRVVEQPDETSQVVETLVSLSSYMNEEEPNIVLPDNKLEELMTEVRTAFKD